MSDVRLRPATPADLPAITAIYAHAVLNGTATFEIDPPDLGEMQRRMDAVLAGGYPYVAAERAGAVVGFGYANVYRTRPAYRWSVEDSIYLAPDAQGQGIGGEILRRLIEDCEARGFRLMIAVIGDSAHEASIRVHRSAGFRDVGTLHNVGHKFERWLDTVIMERPLGEGADAPPGG